MKCNYKFPVKWVVEVEKIEPFTYNGWLYEFALENGRISQISVTVPVTTTDKLPDFSPNPNQPNVIDVSMNLPASYELLMKTLRTLEGFLAVYGLEKIALDETNISWVPESEEEKQKMRVPGFNFRFKKPDSTRIKLPFGVIKQAIMASTETLDWEIPLNFSRKGRNDFMERRFIDAIHDFYFLLENLYANGKTKKSQVLNEFIKSSTLITLTTKVLQEAEHSVARRGKANLLEIFYKKYSKKGPVEYLKEIVKLRGFLHHHSNKNKNIWHPSLEYEYEVDAILLQDLCFKICVAAVEPLICKPRTQNS